MQVKAKGKGAVISQKIEDPSAGVGGSLSEAWGGSGSPQGQGHQQQKS